MTQGDAGERKGREDGDGGRLLVYDFAAVCVRSRRRESRDSLFTALARFVGVPNER